MSLKLCDDVGLLESLVDAVEKSKIQLDQLKEKTRVKIGESESRIFDAHRLIVEDPEFIKAIEDVIKQEQVVPAHAIDIVRKQFESTISRHMDNDYKERKSGVDINDVGNRLFKNVLGIEDHMNIPSQAIIVCEDLEPSDTAALDSDLIAGIVTEKGGETSHSAIIAKSLSIPAITKIKVEDGCELSGKKAILDAITGLFIVDPTDDEIEAYKKKKRGF